jgi:hypothetical protein
LVEHLHGKEGVSGSSPEEGSEKAAQSRLFLLKELAKAPVPVATLEAGGLRQHKQGL